MGIPDSLKAWWSANSRTGPAYSLLLLTLILGAGLGLRLHGIDWDSGYGFHPDERSIYMRAGCMYDLLVEAPGYRECTRDFPATESGLPGPGVFLDADRSPLNPHWFPLGSILIYILVMLRWIIELFVDIGHLDMRYAGRLLSALADLGAVYMVYVLGKSMFSRNAGLLAAALTAFAVVHVQSSHFYRPETFSVFLVLVCFWAMLRMVERRRLRDSLLLGVLVGLAMAPKVSVLPLVLPLAVAYAGWALRSAGGRWSEIGSELVGRMLLHAGAAGLCALAVFFLLTPYALLDFAAFSGELAAQANMARHAGLWPFTIQYVDTPAFWYQIRQTTVWGLGIPLGLVAWSSIPFTVVMAFKGRGTRQADLLLLAWVIPQIVFLESFEVHFLRYYYPLMPFMVLMGSRMLIWLSDSSRTVSFSHSPAARRMIRELPKLAVVLVVVATAFYSLAFQRVYAREHPAVAASQWLQQNLPAGSSLVSDNHWDEFIPELYRYDLWQFPAYDPDTDEKMRSLASHLADADYLVFYSYRPYVSVGRDPERFPLTSVYYRLLFKGELGFQLERSFTSYPELLGVSFRDSPFARAGVTVPAPSVPDESTGLVLDLGYADDNVVGYDHPQVLVFRNAERRPESVLLEQLAPGPGFQQSDDGVGLLLSPADLVKQRAGGTWSEIFHRDGWTNRYPVLAWLLAIELIYLLALPLSVFIFRPLPDRGIVLARVLGLLLVGYVTWLLVSLRWIDFSREAILLGLMVVASLSGIVAVNRWREIRTFLSENWRLLLFGEALFLMAFLAFVLVRAANPDLWHPFRGGEKPMELAYLNAVVRSTTFPPYDPWYAGGYLNYYYWGYYLVALPIRLTGIIPTTAFNLAVPLFFALTFTGAYSIAYNLVEGVKRSRGGGGEDAPRSGGKVALGGAVGAGLAAGVFASVMGNLDGGVQLVQGTWSRLYGGAPGFPAFDFWRSSRIIPPLEEVEPSPLAFWAPDKSAGFADVSFHITEFPFFTFLFADLHAHMMVIPFTVLVIGLGLNLVLGLKGESRWWTVAASGLLGLALGALWVINSWDYPPYLALVLALLVLAVYFTHRYRWQKAAMLVSLMIGVAAVSALAFLPFHQVYETFDAGAARSRWQTPIDRYLAIHGLFLFVTVTFLIHQLGRGWVGSWRALVSVRGAEKAPVLPHGYLRSGRFRKGLCYFLALMVMLYLLAAGYWTSAALTVLLLLTAMGLWKVLAGPGPDRPYLAVPLLLLGMALGIGVGVDFVRLNGDIGRMNTLFKLYLEAWVLFSIAAAFMLWYLGDRGWLRRRWDWSKAVWAGILMVLLSSSLIYTSLGTRARIADRFNGGPITLDGTAYLHSAVHVEEGQPLQLRTDLEGIRWLQDNVEGSPVVLEAHHEQYHWSARISSYTGLPTVIGWPWHQIQQRNAYAGTIGQRARDVSEMYNSTDLERTRQLLESYQVEYVVVGELERAYYSAEGTDKFQAMVEEGWALLVLDGEGMKVYRIL